MNKNIKAHHEKIHELYTIVVTVETGQKLCHVR